MTLNPKLDSSCVLALSFDEESGNIAYDQSQYGNDGTIYGATRVRGIIGKALSFDGVDDYVEVPDSESLDITDAITIMAWIKRESTGTRDVIVAKECAYIFFIEDDDFLKAWLYDGNIYNGFKSVKITDNKWHFVAMTFDINLAENQLKFYLDGVLASTHTHTKQIYTSTYSLKIGLINPGWAKPGWFDGIIDEVRIYNRALSEKEIKTLYYYGNQSLRHAPYLLR